MEVGLVAHVVLSPQKSSADRRFRSLPQSPGVCTAHADIVNPVGPPNPPSPWRRARPGAMREEMSVHPTRPRWGTTHRRAHLFFATAGARRRLHLHFTLRSRPRELRCRTLASRRLAPPLRNRCPYRTCGVPPTGPPPNCGRGAKFRPTRRSDSPHSSHRLCNAIGRRTVSPSLATVPATRQRAMRPSTRARPASRAACNPGPPRSCPSAWSRARKEASSPSRPLRPRRHVRAPTRSPCGRRSRRNAQRQAQRTRRSGFLTASRRPLTCAHAPSRSNPTPVWRGLPPNA